MDVVILLIPGAPASVITGLCEFFEFAGIDLENRRKPPICRVRTAAIQSEPVQLHGNVQIKPDLVGRCEKTDLVIVPAVGPNVFNLKRRCGLEIEWLKDASTKADRIASVCSGAFLLAATGLLDGLSATTHWQFASFFRRMFPTVHLDINKLVIDQGKFLTSGGSNAFYDLSLHVLEQSLGREVALKCAKHFLLDSDRISQTPFMTFATQKHHDDQPIATAQDILENEFNTAISMESLAQRVGISSRSLKRRFKEATGEPPSTYLQRLRIEWARRRLEETGDSIEEVSYAVGYENVGFFRVLFKRYIGMTPLEHRRRHSLKLPVRLK
ncbi:AraC family transcriptional regulator [Leptospira yasudae]|uniref:GlxA family transcriptional regulator n=1 Tax=Leptospira yasudae TaxID=2202201 RepID=UPI000E59B15F|nr:helix-turn-helix domain-containing protein [Leptospira yasudae]RHX94768.1 AraC family transcriptional regulator [Leptospira yasudae]TGK30180.1 helix-turn-helix domain-containing protein [Leptospira yasudae]TGM04440.1 helix-turn-helix domain-containing protein [Leptospira yasudae]TGN00965.1 helix-turn-helix domain-containing protein [Leptospira yasudae]